MDGGWIKMNFDPRQRSLFPYSWAQRTQKEKIPLLAGTYYMILVLLLKTKLKREREKETQRKKYLHAFIFSSIILQRLEAVIDSCSV